MSLSDFEDGDRVFVRWYGGLNMPCVVVQTSDGKRVQRETSYNQGTGNKMRVGDRDVVEKPKSWSTSLRYNLKQNGYD